MTRTTSVRGLLTQPKMNLRPGDRLLLHQQAGADFDFAANAERIDALVAEGLRGARPNHLPVIVLGPVVDGLDRLPVRGKAEQIELAVAVQVRRVEDQRRPHCDDRASVNSPFSLPSQISAPAALFAATASTGER